jgi:hypothetical protein
MPKSGPWKHSKAEMSRDLGGCCLNWNLFLKVSNYKLAGEIMLFTKGICHGPEGL